MRYQNFFNTFCVLSSLYLFVSFLLALLPVEIKEHGFLLSKLNLSYLIVEKSRAAAQLMQERNLALNFIGNIRQLSVEEAAAFQGSGLVHLLAISGAQIVPVAQFFASVCAFVLFFFLKPFFSPFSLLRILEKCGAFFSFLTSLFISSLFGCTGALLRVTGLSFFSRIFFVRRFASWTSTTVLYALEASLLRVLILFCLSLAFGNVFANYSFLLSALGASCAELSYILVGSARMHKHPLFVHASTALLTCVLVGFLLIPYSQTSLVTSCLANVCAIPLVTFCITPLSLGVLMLPEGTSFFSFIIHLLDVSLFLLMRIAHVFAPKHFQVNPFSQENPLFTQEALIYLHVVLLVLWVLLDMYKGRGILKIRESVTANLSL